MLQPFLWLLVDSGACFELAFCWTGGPNGKPKILSLSPKDYTSEAYTEVFWHSTATQFQGAYEGETCAVSALGGGIFWWLQPVLDELGRSPAQGQQCSAFLRRPFSPFRVNTQIQTAPFEICGCRGRSLSSGFPSCSYPDEDFSHGCDVQSCSELRARVSKEVFHSVRSRE